MIMIIWQICNFLYLLTTPYERRATKWKFKYLFIINILNILQHQLHQLPQKSYVFHSVTAGMGLHQLTDGDGCLFKVSQSVNSKHFTGTVLTSMADHTSRFHGLWTTSHKMGSALPSDSRELAAALVNKALSVTAVVPRKTALKYC